MKKIDIQKFVFVFIVMVAAMMFAVPSKAMEFSDASIVMVRNSSQWGNYDTKLNFVNQNPDPVEPGSYVELRWKVENIGGSVTDTTLFEIVPEYPFSLDPGKSAIQKLGRIDSFQVGDDAYILYYKLKVDENAVEGASRIKLRYSTDNGKIWQEVPYYIRVQENNFVVMVDSVKLSPESVAPGSDVSVKISLHNMASSEIKDVKVKLATERIDTTAASVIRTNLPFAPIGSSDEKIFSNVKPMEVKDVEFRLSVDATAESKIHKVPVSVTYDDTQGNTYTKDFIVGIKVFDKPDYLINLEEKSVYKNDQKGRFLVSISNRGFSNINFLSVRLISSEDFKTISPDIVYIGNLKSDDFESAEFEIYVDTQKESVPVTLELSYKDDYNNEYKDVNKQVVIPLYSTTEAQQLGYEAPKNKTNLFAMIAVFVILTVFWLFMIIHVLNSKDTKYHKIIWVVMILLTYVLGAAVYYLFGRKKQSHD